MDTILQLLIGDIAMGFIYALVVIGYTLIWNSTGLLNLSHDKIITVGAYISAATLITKFNMNRPLAIVSTFMFVGILGSVIASGIFNPLRHMRSNVFVAMGTMVLGGILAEAIRPIYGSVSFTIENRLSGTIKIDTFMVTKANAAVCVVTILVVVALQLLMNFTEIEEAIRYVAQNEKAVASMGTNMARDTCVTAAVDSIMCSITGAPIISLFDIPTTTAASIGLRGFSAEVIGGSGHLPKTILGSLFIGMTEDLAVMILPAVYEDIMSFVLLAIFLLVHPSGFSSKKARKE